MNSKKSSGIKIEYIDACPNWEEFFDKYEGIIKEEDLDLTDPITAGILRKK